jgi:dTMP kinase
MRNRKISSYKKYKQVLTQEDADRKHEQWMAEEELRKRKAKEADRKGLEEWQTMLKNDIRLKKQKEERKRVAELVAEQQVEKIRQREIERDKEVKRIAEAKEKWEADKPAREARIKAETERLQAEEQRKQKEAEERRRAYNALQDQDYAKFRERANKNYAEWPEDIREYHQRTEDAEIKLMISQGLTDDQIAKYLERDKKLHWPPVRSRV